MREGKNGDIRKNWRSRGKSNPDVAKELRKAGTYTKARLGKKFVGS